VHLHTIQVN